MANSGESKMSLSIAIEPGIVSGSVAQYEFRFGRCERDLKRMLPTNVDCFIEEAGQRTYQPACETLFVCCSEVVQQFISMTLQLTPWQNQAGRSAALEGCLLNLRCLKYFENTFTNNLLKIQSHFQAPQMMQNE